jgi:hypothetical protein
MRSGTSPQPPPAGTAAEEGLGSARFTGMDSCWGDDPRYAKGMPKPEGLGSEDTGLLFKPESKDIEKASLYRYPKEGLPVWTTKIPVHRQEEHVGRLVKDSFKSKRTRMTLAKWL